MLENVELNHHLDKITQYEDALRFLLTEIECILTDGDDFDFEKADKFLIPLGIRIKEDYFQP